MRNHLFKGLTVEEKMEALELLIKKTADAKQFKLCELRDVVMLSKSSHHARINRSVSPMQARKNRLKLHIFKVFYEFKSIYGAPKVHAVLIERELDEGVTKRTISVYMREMSLKSITTPHFKIEKLSETQLPYNIPMMNYIKTERPVKPRTHLLTDITYIHTIKNGWTYLLTFMDMFTRKIIAWDICETMSAKWVTSIAIEALKVCPDAIYIHSDQGCQYTSRVYLSTILKLGVSPSFSSKGYPYHNAWIESFHSQLKRECIYRRTLKDYEEAKTTCFNYIEGFYNTIRIQKALSYKSPNEFERTFKEIKIYPLTIPETNNNEISFKYSA